MEFRTSEGKIHRGDTDRGKETERKRQGKKQRGDTEDQRRGRDGGDIKRNR
jgi:hypothetical protein